ncbi:hypothetical protein GF314_00295 [bacterium]|nr:hypothetical protein [bacterium]
MSGKLVGKVLLEGTRLTHKTDLAFALNEHPRFVGPRRYRYHSPVVSGEWCGFTNHPWGRGLINFDPEREYDHAMATFATWATLFEQLRYYTWIVDRFHVSTRCWQKLNHGLDLDFRWLEERLAAVGFRIVHCVRRPETFAAAREERLKVSGKPSQYDDLQIFLDEQETLRELINESSLMALEVDVSDDDVTAAADRVCDWLETTGGMTLDDDAS